MHSVPETNLTSSLFLNQIEYALHLLLSPVTMQQVSSVRLAFERIQGLLDFACKVVKPAIFVVFHLQDPVGHLCTNFCKSIHVFSERISHKSFKYLMRLCPMITVKLNSSGLQVFRLDRFGVDGFDLNRFGITTNERWDLC